MQQWWHYFTGKQQEDRMQSSSSQRRQIQILDRPLRSNRTEVSHSAFAFLFSEMVQYAYNRISSIDDLSLRLEELGFGVGQRLIELISCRDRVIKRETRIVGILQYITTTIWKQVFNKNADTLERAMEDEDEYMIHESNPITNTFVSIPSDLGQLDCAAYIAGIIAGILDSAKFPAKVTAHIVEQGNGLPAKTVFLIKFSTEVMSRESRFK